MIKAIETSYAGCRFRSRLEARWAVFFDSLGLKWDYEPQGYMVGRRLYLEPRTYLPDFFLPGFNAWVEVKGDASNIEPLYLYSAAMELAELHGDNNRNRPSLILLGDIPRPSDFATCHNVLVHHKGDCLLGTMGFGDNSSWGRSERIMLVNDALNHCWWAGEARCSHAPDDLSECWVYGTAHHALFKSWDDFWPADKDVTRAHFAARSARFEHGERGARRS